MTHAQPRRIVRELIPGIALPAVIYFLVSRHAPVLVALAAASSVPALDAVGRLIRGRAPSPVGLCFMAITAVSVVLAFRFQSPLFILVKGAITTGLLGMAFGVSALIRRPLTRTLAIRLSTDGGEERTTLAHRWGHPKVVKVFTALSVGWGVLLIASALQQAGLALTASPGVVMGLEGPIQLAFTAAGVGASVLYVRRHDRDNPDLALIPRRSG
jgi:hypothetical protein